MRKSTLCLVLISLIILVPSLAHAAWLTLYETDFSSDPGWDTNNSARYYWDSSSQGFYADNYTESGDWATKTIDYNGESFRLQFDIKPTNQLPGYGDIDFGLFGPERKSHFYYGSSTERMFGFLGGYNTGNQLALEGASATGSQISLMPDPDRHINLNTWYQYDIQYDNLSGNINFSVTHEGDSGPLFSLSDVIEGGLSNNLDYLGVSMNGNWVESDRHLSALVDNVKMEVNTNYENGTPPTDGSHPRFDSSLLVYDGLSNRFVPIDNNINSEYSTILLTHGRNPDGTVSLNTQPWIEAAAAIQGNTGDNYNIVGWNWPENAIGEPLDKVPDVAWNEGHKLAISLKNNGLLKDLHMISHSAGSIVIGAAAEVIANNYGFTDHLTFLDPWNGLQEDYLLDVTGDSIWADNYMSSVIGRRVFGAYNADIPVPDNTTDKHGYAITWYTATAVNPSKEKSGFYWSEAGGGWDNNRPRPNSGTEKIPINEKRRDDFLEWEWQRKNTVYKDADYVIMKVASDAFLFREINFPEEYDFLSFDFNFHNPGDGDYLTLNFNDESLFFFEGMNFVGNDFINSGLIDIRRYSGQQGYLTFALKGVGDIHDAELALTNLRYFEYQTQTSAVPEPSTFILIGLGLFFTNILSRRTTSQKTFSFTEVV